MELGVEHLRPYTSLLLARVDENLTPRAAAGRILTAVKKLLEVNGDPKARRKLVEGHVRAPRETFAAGYMHYVERRRPAWLSPSRSEPVDQLNQLVLAACWNSYAAIYLSEPGARAAFNRAFVPAGKRPKARKFLPELEPFQPGLLNAAFIENEPLRTLWLTGIHRRTPSKADSKVLTGLDLENALSPLADQTYYFTAARSYAHLTKAGGLAVGVKPRMSRLWAGPVSDWDAFVDRLEALFEHLKAFDDGNKTVMAPVSHLAAPVEGDAEIRSAYDVSVIAPEILSNEPTANEQQLQLAARWAYSSQFKSFRPAKDSPSFSVEILVEGQSLGRFNFAVEVDDSGAAGISVAAEPPISDDEDSPRVEAIAVCSDPGWLTVRYESGHSISDGVVYSVRHRDVRFKGWKFAPMTDIDVTKEKPTVKYQTDKGETREKFAPDKIGEQDSLFCWVQRFWPPGDRLQRGWLACDDGPGEIADFIHFDPTLREGPLVTLIHVKGSGSDSGSRQISTSDYEVVVGQAVKNLRLLDRIHLADQLEAGKSKEVAPAVWFDGSRRTRDELITQLREVGDNYRRRVLVLQPRVTATELGKVERDIDRGRKTARIARVQQLDTLLVAAQADCAALQAEFFVLSQRV